MINGRSLSKVVVSSIGLLVLHGEVGGVGSGQERGLLVCVRRAAPARRVQRRQERRRLGRAGARA